MEKYCPKWAFIGAAHFLEKLLKPHEDYATSWKKSWKPFRVGDLCVVAPWHAGSLRSEDVRLTLEPGNGIVRIHGPA